MASSVLRAAGTAAACMLSVTFAGGQPRPEQKSQMAEQVFKNVRVLKGIPVNEFMATMGFFSASLGENCTFCHVQESGGSWEKYAEDNDHKRTARSMIAMVGGINKTYFAGRRMLTCYSCHRGGEHPRVTPNLAELYGPPPAEEPDTLQPASAKVSPDQIFEKYLEALGGAQRLAGVSSFIAKGTYQGFGDEKHPVEVFAKAPNQRSVVVHTGTEDSTTIYDGRTAWIASPVTERPVPVLELTGGDLEGARLDAALAFPARIKQALNQWRAGFPGVIDDRDVQTVQGTSDGRYPVNLYFDSQSGLLVRIVRYTDSPVGLSPTQVDYSNYREVAGVKMPFKWTISWLDGRSNVELTEVQLNAAIDAARFARPAR